METASLIAPRICAVLLDETEDCDSGFAERCGGSVYTLYWYNAAEAVHCCELTPSYCLYELATVPATLPDDPDDRETLLSECDECTAGSVTPRYFRCHGIDAIPATMRHNLGITPKVCRFSVSEYTPEEWAAALENFDGDADQALEDAVQQLRCNGAFYW